MPPVVKRNLVQRGNVIDLADVRPIILRVETEVQSNADSEVQSLALMNPTGEPVEIREFKFTVRPKPNVPYVDSTPALQTAFVSGGNVGVSLKVAGKPLTNGPIPIWNFGSSYTLGLEDFSFTPADVSGPTQILNLGGHYRFKLDEPLYLPPGVAVEASVKSFGGFESSAFVSIVAIGSVLPHRPTPSKIKVPWVCVYSSKSFAFEDVGSDSSPETSLINPFNVPLHVRRFVGRIAQISRDEALGITYVSDADNPFSVVAGVGTGGALGYYESVFKVRMRDSVGNPLVRAADFFRNVFDGKTRAWETNVKLPPRQYYRVDVEKGNIPGLTFENFVGGLYVPSVSRAQLQVSLVGWREESL